MELMDSQLTNHVTNEAFNYVEGIHDLYIGTDRIHRLNEEEIAKYCTYLIRGNYISRTGVVARWDSSVKKLERYMSDCAPFHDKNALIGPYFYPNGMQGPGIKLYSQAIDIESNIEL